jgi:hypothetical protein
MGCMGNEDLSRVGSMELTALLMSLERCYIHEGGWNARKVASGGSQGRKAKKLSRGEKFGADRRVGRSSARRFWLVASFFPLQLAISYVQASDLMILGESRYYRVARFCKRGDMGACAVGEIVNTEL